MAAAANPIGLRVCGLRRPGYPGSWLVAIGLAAICLAALGAGRQANEAPVILNHASENPAYAAPTSTGADDGPRITYLPGHYPVLSLPGGATRQVRSILNLSHRLAFGDYVWNADGVLPGKVWVRIDLARQLLSVFRGSDEIGTAVIIFGTKAKPTPVGVLHVLAKSEYYFSRSYGAAMPYALRLTGDGVALHASTVRERSATHGCVGMPLEFARLLYREISRGDEVDILPDRDGV